jgi:type III secretory pathway component EscU
MIPIIESFMRGYQIRKQMRKQKREVKKENKGNDS